MGDESAPCRYATAKWVARAPQCAPPWACLDANADLPAIKINRVACQRARPAVISSQHIGPLGADWLAPKYGPRSPEPIEGGQSWPLSGGGGGQQSKAGPPHTGCLCSRAPKEHFYAPSAGWRARARENRIISCNWMGSRTGTLRPDGPAPDEAQEARGRPIWLNYVNMQVKSGPCKIEKVVVCREATRPAGWLYSPFDAPLCSLVLSAHAPKSGLRRLSFAQNITPHRQQN